MQETIKITTHPWSEAIHYIQTSLKRYAITLCASDQDADDFIQETILRFLRAQYYQDRTLIHQKNLAKKILHHLFNAAKRDGQKLRIFYFPNWSDFDGDMNPLGARMNHIRWERMTCEDDPDSRIDGRNLLHFMAERDNDQVNLFWLRHIGYTLEEIQAIFGLTREEIHEKVSSGRKLLLRHLKNGASRPTKKICLKVREEKKAKDGPAIARQRTFKERRKKLRPVNQYTLRGKWIRSWRSPTEAQNHFNPQASAIRAMLRGAKQQAYGFIWSYEGKAVKWQPRARIPFIRA